MLQIAWLAKRNPFSDRKAFADVCEKNGNVPSVDTMIAWEVDYLQFLLPNARWHWIDDTRNVAQLRPDVVVLMSNDFSLVGLLDDVWTPKILVYLSDEWGRNPMIHRLTERVPLVLRQYRFKHYYRPHNLRHIPLGFMACMFADPMSIASPDLSTERDYRWSFVGTIKGERASAIATFNAWHPNLQKSCAPDEQRQIYLNSDFVLCPRGNVSMDCFRNYEATICGAIPVVAGCSKEEYSQTFLEIGDLPWVFAETWDVALEICRSLVKSGSVAELRKKNSLWWSTEIQSLRSAIQLALDGLS